MLKKIISTLIVTTLALFGSAQAQEVNPVVVMTTSAGVIEIEMMPEQAPASVENFLMYVEKGFYKGTIFHRVIDNFMIQGGGFDQDMSRKEAFPPIMNESMNGLNNDKGTISMARTNDPDSATSQFFINLKDNDFLNPRGRQAGYAVFGKVVSGIEIVEAIGKTSTGVVGPYRDVPKEAIIIENVTVK
ncbi:peptidylprolyl isomerase [Amphritea sp. HPY]|uniref:peptidylprolyl isomerase n=1 Tax=Amphritea sp. HPY TaxID=3421652 RepID=UPI003D7E0641